MVSLLLFGGLWSAVGSSNLAVVTCGSVVKLLNTRHNVRLHSHDVRYGSGTAIGVRVGWEGLVGSGGGGAWRNSEGCGLGRLEEPRELLEVWRPSPKIQWSLGILIVILVSIWCASCQACYIITFKDYNVTTGYRLLLSSFYR